MTLQERFLGKRVRVINTQTPFDKNATIAGICTYIGPNEFLKKDKTITIGRMPIFLDSYDQCSVIED